MQEQHHSMSSINHGCVKCRAGVDRAVLGWRYDMFAENWRYADGIHSEAWVYQQSPRLVDWALLPPPHLSRPKDGAGGWVE
jgi:hypothetical protein